MLLASSLMFVNCTSDLDQGPAGPEGPAGVDGQDGKDGEDGIGTGSSETVLLAKKALIGPTVDGVIDASWSDAQILTGTAGVPNPEGDDGTIVFNGYVGNTRDFQVKAQYDDEYVYFLAQWKDDQQDASRDTWYFDATDNLWKQESNKPVFDTDNTTKLREAFYEDKFAMQWQIGTVENWEAISCYATCHADLTEAEGYAKHYTLAAGEQTDMWHWKSVRTGPNGQFDDKHVTDTPQDGARHGDAKVSGGYSNNKQTLKLDGTGADVSVPKYYIPGETDYYWILESEVTDNTALLITAVASDGTLTDEDGNEIDPNVDLDYQRDATTLNQTPALKGMPSITTTAFVGSRGDITSGQTYTGNGWILEFKRKLNTGNSDDVVFDTTKSYQFGLGIFDNAAIAHAIKTDLTFSFEQ